MVIGDQGSQVGSNRPGSGEVNGVQSPEVWRAQDPGLIAAAEADSLAAPRRDGSMHWHAP